MLNMSMCYLMWTSFIVISTKNSQPYKSHANDFHDSHGPMLITKNDLILNSTPENRL